MDAKFVDVDAKKIDAIFSSLNQNRYPGAAVGIAHWGKPLYRQGFGLANMEQDVVLAPRTRMRVFSISKHFAGLCYLLLCEDGKAKLDEPIGTYLPELAASARAVTPRQVMGHLSGLRDIFDMSWQFSGTGWNVPSTHLLALYREIREVNTNPGDSWIYNNGGWLMLSAAIERISGASLENFLRDRVFIPIGMNDSLLRRFDTDFVPNSASLHMTDSSGRYEKSYLGGALAGEGGIVSTVDDMLHWLNHMRRPFVGSADTWSLITTPQKLSNGTSTEYGFGLHIQKYRGIEIHFHSGGGMGGSSHMVRVPEAGLDVIILVNREDVSATLLAEEILDACLPGLEPLPDEAGHHKDISRGIFCSSTTGRTIELVAKEEQQIISIDGMDMPAKLDDAGFLCPSGVFRNLKQSIRVVGDYRSPDSVLLTDFGEADEFTRRPTPTQLIFPPEMTGRYRRSGPRVEATIYKSELGLRLRTTADFGSADYQLECLSSGIWRARLPGVFWRGGILLFSSDYSSFRFSTYRTRALQFERVT